MSHQSDTLPSVEERLERIRKEIRGHAPSLVPDFSKRTAELDPKTRQLLRQLDQFAGEDNDKA